MNDTLQRIKEVLARDHTDSNKLETIAEIIENCDICYSHKAYAKCIKREIEMDKCGDKPCRIEP